jgi:hypothetical protein
MNEFLLELTDWELELLIEGWARRVNIFELSPKKLADPKHSSKEADKITDLADSLIRLNLFVSEAERRAEEEEAGEDE